MKTSYFLLVFLFAVFVVFGATASTVSAATTSGYAWSENTAWLDFSQVTVSDSALAGYAYSPNIGWVSMSCSNTSSCDTVDYGVTNSSGTLSGYAWSENVGWLDFSDATIGTSDGEFSGYAYSANIGWVSLNCSNTSSCDTVDYGVTTEWRPPSDDDDAPPTPTTISGSVPRRSPSVPAPVSTPTPTQNPPAPFFCGANPNFTFQKNLEFRMTHEDVRCLQRFLNSNGDLVSIAGPGSPGQETNLFGLLTRAAVIRFQKEHNISPTIGFFGPITRAAVNSIITNVKNVTVHQNL